MCCISYYSYIKPQPTTTDKHMSSVVYRTIPTSNHNHKQEADMVHEVVYRTIPTSNHNVSNI